MTRLTSLFRKSSKTKPDQGLDLEGTAQTSTSNDTLEATHSGSGLPYKLRNHKGHWALWFAAFLFDGAVLPVVLFYGLWYGSSVSKWTVLAVTTSLTFWTSYHKWFSRGWRLLITKKATYRPLHSRRFAPDTSYIILTLALGIMILELVIATATKDVKVRVISMAPVSTLYVIAAYMLLQNTMYMLGIKAPFQLSSCMKGERVWPALATVMEDVFCVDGCHEGSAARERIRGLVEDSHAFRKATLLWGWIWGVLSLALAIGLSIVVGLTSRTTGFGICYGVSWPFIAVLAIVNAWWMERQDAKGMFTSAQKAVQ